MQRNQEALRSLGPAVQSTSQLLREDTRVRLHDATTALRMAQDAVLHETLACGERLGWGEPLGAGPLLERLLQGVRYGVAWSLCNGRMWL